MQVGSIGFLLKAEKFGPTVYIPESQETILLIKCRFWVKAPENMFKNIGLLLRQEFPITKQSGISILATLDPSIFDPKGQTLTLNRIYEGFSKHVLSFALTTISRIAAWDLQCDAGLCRDSYTDPLQDSPLSTR